MGIEEDKTKLVISELFTTVTLTRALEKHRLGAKEFYEMLKKVPSLALDYAHAQESRAEMLADEIIDIADNEEDAQKARNRIDVRKWAASKMKPDKFGDRLDLNVSTTVDIRGALDAAHSRVRAVLEIQKTQLPETTIAIPSEATGCKPAEDDRSVILDLSKLLD